MNTVAASAPQLAHSVLQAHGLACNAAPWRTRWAALPERTANVPGCLAALTASAAAFREVGEVGEAEACERAARSLSEAVLVPFRVMLRNYP